MESSSEYLDNRRHYFGVVAEKLYQIMNERTIDVVGDTITGLSPEGTLRVGMLRFDGNRVENGPNSRLFAIYLERKLSREFENVFPGRLLNFQKMSVNNVRRNPAPNSPEQIFEFSGQIENMSELNMKIRGTGILDDRNLTILVTSITDDPFATNFSCHTVHFAE